LRFEGPGAGVPEFVERREEPKSPKMEGLGGSDVAEMEEEKEEGKV